MLRRQRIAQSSLFPIDCQDVMAKCEMAGPYFGGGLEEANCYD